MKRGIFFIESGGNFFAELEHFTEISGHIWLVDDTEFNHYECKAGEYEGEAFRSAYPELSEACFARVRQYPMNAKPAAIDSFEDYLESDCEMLILYYDGGDYELFAKDELLLERAYAFCRERSVRRMDFMCDGDRSWMHF